MPVVVSHATADEPWAQWIALSLHAAGHQVRLDPAGRGFAERLTHSGDELVLLLLSAVHRATPADWAELVHAPTLVGRLATIRLDTTDVPRELRALPGRSLYGLDEEDALEVLLALAGGIRRHKSGPPGLPPPTGR